MELESQSHGLWVLPKFAIQLKCRVDQVGVLRVWDVRYTAGQVQAHPRVGILQRKKKKNNNDGWYNLAFALDCSPTTFTFSYILYIHIMPCIFSKSPTKVTKSTTISHTLTSVSFTLST